MTADLETCEYLAVAGTAQAALAEGAAGGAWLFHRYGRIEIADAPAPGPAEAPTPEAAAIPADLSLTETLGLDAFARRMSDTGRAAKRDRPWQGLSWQGAGGHGPGPLHPPGMAIAGDAAALAPPAPGTPLSARLKGRVALGLVMVEGPSPHLQFSTADRTLVVAEVQNGLSFLASQAPDRDVSFTHEISVLRVDAPEVHGGGFEAQEAPWRDPALALLGHGPGLAGADACARALRDRLGTDWAYIAFFTKYPLAHFAYAGLGGPRLVMHFDNDGWGPDQIDRVFAHETGHIFHAPDEYAQSGCDCGGAWGHYGVPNANCASCAPAGGVKCIMRSNDWAMCDATRRHLGYGGLDPQKVPLA